MMFLVFPVIVFSYNKNVDILLKNMQLLLTIVVIASALQKLISPQFMSGDFYYFMANRGYLFNAFLRFFPESLEVIKSNSQSIKTLQDTDPNLLKSIVLSDISPYLSKVSPIFAWITVAVEFIVAIALLWKPKSTLTHLLYAGMILGILCTRLETGFMALLAIGGIFLCQNVKLRLLYVMIVIGCLTLVVTQRGFA
jgi:hypothetical protein